MRRGISGLLIVGVAVGLLAGCAGKGKPPAAVTKKQAPKQEKTSVKAEFHKAHISWADAKGRPVMEAGFKEAVASSNGDTAIVELVGVKADLFQDGKPASSLRAERIVADSRKKEIRAAGNIRITSGDGSLAQCERATWKSSANRIIGSGGVKLTKGNITITADRFEADTGLKHVRFYQGKAEVSNAER